MGLKFEKVTKRFGKITAVDQLSLSLTDKEMLGFLGANGTGKTITCLTAVKNRDGSESN